MIISIERICINIQHLFLTKIQQTKTEGHFLNLIKGMLHPEVRQRQDGCLLSPLPFNTEWEGLARAVRPKQGASGL